jgi:hypothetical protein
METGEIARRYEERLSSGDFTYPHENGEWAWFEGIPVLIQYVKEPFSFSSGFFNMKKMLAAANGKLLDKKGCVITAAEYIKSSIEIRKVGYLIAFQDDSGTILIGWAQWDKNDKYEPEFGITVAMERAIKYKNKTPKHIPFKVAEALPKFMQRVKAYFKNGKMVEWAAI